MNKAFEAVGFVVGEVVVYLMTNPYLDCVNYQLGSRFGPACPNPNGLARWMAGGFWQLFAGYILVGTACLILVDLGVWLLKRTLGEKES